ncbi:MAG TPA: SRPBCC family protein [Steroidobacteraceae bacterium]|jgi:polyketide cyclase/dehydrase/lipid transport protein|nr:SRPBCC family protein [Steroidobacteraceae bacterium]HJY36236.1 SRPBCC family protein [Steroidobacteraceae bacterium]
MSRSVLAVVLLASASLWAAAAGAFEIEKSETRYADRRYQCELSVKLDAPPDKVQAVLRDYERYPALDTRILQARVLERPEPNVAVLETTVRVCFGWFCRNVTRVERVQESEHSLAATADPSRSDVKFGETSTQLSPDENGGTLVHYRTSITPAFWIPAVVGRRWMLRTLEDASGDLFMNVEMRAKKEQAQEKAASN